MRKTLSLLLTLALLPAFASALAEDIPLLEIVSALPDYINVYPPEYNYPLVPTLQDSGRVSVDLDGDGVPEEVSWSIGLDEISEGTLAVGDAAYQLEISPAAQVYIVDLDGDGTMEILISGDTCSWDYFTWCLRYADGMLYEVLFPDARRDDNEDGYFKQGYGQVIALEGNRLILSGTQDIMGTWFAHRAFMLAPSGHFEFADDGVWIRDFPTDSAAIESDLTVLTLTASVPWFKFNGEPAGTLQPGDKIIVYASDKQDHAWFVTRDGKTSGMLSISPDYDKSYGWRLNGIPENDCFEIVPYGD